VALLKTDVSEECITSIVRVKIDKVGKTLAIIGNVVPSSLIVFSLIKVVLRSSETSVLTRATQRNIPGDDNLHRHRRENLTFYIALTG
jgi:hypothetical protein